MEASTCIHALTDHILHLDQISHLDLLVQMCVQHFFLMIYFRNWRKDAQWQWQQWQQWKAIRYHVLAEKQENG